MNSAIAVGLLGIAQRQKTGAETLAVTVIWAGNTEVFLQDQFHELENVLIRARQKWNEMVRYDRDKAKVDGDVQRVMRLSVDIEPIETEKPGVEFIDLGRLFTLAALSYS